MNLIEKIWEKARVGAKTIVLPEGDEPRTVAAAAILVREGLARPILLGNPERIRAVAAEKTVGLAGVAIADPATDEKAKAYAQALYELRKAKGVR